jgi:hypothetical protein
MHRNIYPRSVGQRARCVMCGGDFRSIRYRFERAQFCTKRCLDRHLATRTDQPTSLKAWIEEARQLTPLP